MCSPCLDASDSDRHLATWIDQIVQAIWKRCLLAQNAAKTFMTSKNLITKARKIGDPSGIA
jgi:hypothetical protein